MENKRIKSLWLEKFRRKNVNQSFVGLIEHIKNKSVFSYYCVICCQYSPSQPDPNEFSTWNYWFTLRTLILFSDFLTLSVLLVSCMVQSSGKPALSGRCWTDIFSTSTREASTLLTHCKQPQGFIASLTILNLAFWKGILQWKRNLSFTTTEIWSLQIILVIQGQKIQRAKLSQTQPCIIPTAHALVFNQKKKYLVLISFFLHG